MLFRSLIPLVALAGNSLADKNLQNGRLQVRDKLAITEEEVDNLDLYAQYALAAPCNTDTPVGDIVACEVNCDRVHNDGAVILGTYFGNETEIAAYLSVSEFRKQIIFSVRGSSTQKNWETNFDFATVGIEHLVRGGKIHKGFSRAWKEISHNVTVDLDDARIKYPDYGIVFVGHSLGGAVATVGAGHLRADDEYGFKIDLYTYGAPRIGNRVLSDFITAQEGKDFRVTHRGDPVPRLPPVFWPFNKLNYRHTSPEYWLMGKPEDPDHWPIEDIKLCEGGFNPHCNSHPFLFVNVFDHVNYFGPMSCKSAPGPDFIGGTYFPKSIQDNITAVLDREEPNRWE